MFPKEWAPPCGSCCNKKYAALVQIPWRIFCKKGCDTDGDTWDECQEECNYICYKDPVLKDQNWSSLFDRSPGHDGYSKECFRACISGCGYKFDIPKETVEKTQPNRPIQLQPEDKPEPALPHRKKPQAASDDLPCISA